MRLVALGFMIVFWLTPASLAQEIPFRVVHNMLLLPVQVNGVKMNARLDNGGIYSIIHSATASSLGLTFAGHTTVGGFGTPARVELKAPVKVKVGDLEVATKPLILIDLHSMGPAADVPIGITLGLDVMRDLVVEIDFDRSVIKFTPVASYKDVPKSAPLQIRRVGQDRSITGAITGSSSAMVDFDIGNPGAVELTEKLAQSALKGQPSSSFVATAIDGAFALKSSTVPSLTVGGSAFSNIPAYVRSRKGERIGLGMEILKRFNMVLDFSHDRMWMTPNSNTDLPFTKDRVGLWTDDNGWPGKVLLVSPGSPAARAGFKAGETIKCIVDDTGTKVAFPEELSEGRQLTITMSDDSRREIVAASYF